MKYTVVYNEKVIKQLKKIDKHQREIILKWINKNLDGTSEPRSRGKSLNGDLGEYWRYRIGKYRIITTIDDKKIIIQIVSVGYRNEVYKK